jgi:hypothetical protein
MSSKSGASATFLILPKLVLLFKIVVDILSKPGFIAIKYWGSILLKYRLPTDTDMWPPYTINRQYAQNKGLQS